MIGMWPHAGHARRRAMHDLLIALAFIAIIVTPSIVASNATHHSDKEN